MDKECKVHGLVKHNRRSEGGWRCQKCASEAVARRRRLVKATLVEEHGGKCVICGYNKYQGALDFHHADPNQKSFGISAKGMTYSLDRMREEAEKCLLLCKNCHSEIEGGVLSWVAKLGAAPDC